MSVVPVPAGEPLVELPGLVPEAEALRRVPRELARRLGLLPLAFEPSGPRLSLAMADPADLLALDRVRAVVGADVELVVLPAARGELERALERAYESGPSLEGLLRELDTGAAPSAPRPGLAPAEAGPTVRLVDALLAEAVRRGASDVHFEPGEGLLRVRCRIDGVLRQVRALRPEHWPAMAVRLKVMAGVDIAENRAPQDGRLSLALGGRQVDMRLATLPTLHGENIVLRVLDRERAPLALADLHLEPAARSSLERMVARPEGLLLVTGPTGSGKTTTLYAVLGHLDAERLNIMTLEDPVECRLPGIRQSPVNEAARLDFAGGLRAILRQDPDVVLVGEIRDEQTASMAVRAAMTGHQVLSSLHTSTVFGAVSRLRDLGVRPQSLAGHLVGVLAQRLVRRLCPHCRQALPPQEAQRLGLGEAARGAVFYRATGCARCDLQGYRGRLAVVEVLEMDEELEELLARGASRRELARAARARGFRTLAEAGLARALRGETTLEELGRVVGLHGVRAP